MTKRWMQLVANCTLITLAWPLASLASGNDSNTEVLVTQSQNQANHYHAEIRRTSMGVPHIKADNWRNLGYGYGYAQAEDNLCTMADAFITYRGERSRYLGAEAGPLNGSTLEAAANLDSDFYHKHIISPDVIANAKAAQNNQLRELITGFAAGYNRYLQQLKSSSNTAHSACRYAAWVRPIDNEDIYRRMVAANLAGGYSNWLNGIASAQPPTSNTPIQKKSLSQKLLPEHIKLPAMQVGGKHGVGSNMIAYGSAATDTGSPLLFGNPHWYWRGPDRFYQAQLSIPGQINVSGVSFLGVPVILIGYNEHVAWSHTVSTARRFGFYELNLVSDDPSAYLRDGKKVKMTAVKLNVEVLQADGRLGQVKRTLYRSEYGPMINLGLLNPGLAWNANTAFAIRDINADNFRSFRNWLRWNQASSLDEFIRIQKQELAIPWVNTTAIGRGSSKVWYADIGAVPNVSSQQTQDCTTPIGQMLGAIPQLARIPFFDGSRSSCDWKTDPDSAQSGAIGAARMPSLQRADYVANMNDSYWSSNPKQLLSGYPDIMGDTGNESLSMRTRLGHIMAQGRLDGNDGYAGNKASMETLKQMVLNSRALTAELFKSQAIALICAKPQINLLSDPETGQNFAGQAVDVRAACGALRAWDNTGNPDARAAHVWDEFWRRASQIPEAQLYQVQFDASDAIHTPRDLKPAVSTDLQQAFAAAVMRVQASGFGMYASRAETLYLTRNQRRIGLYGGCEYSGYFTVACSDNRLDRGGYSMDFNPNGNSYMQLVNFEHHGVQAFSMLSHSLSDDPASLRYSNSSERYAHKHWLKLPFSEHEIRNDAGYHSVVISQH
ncbi:penicillin acylase family protein [Undibacterium sp. Ren11W]|uniref:penicillin acylase family protein n=1 Tax=Undibacterium sp. Ren11W TaxID=3413045 RepID=UPI003BF266D2